jgi:hypothetical protein
MTTYREQILKNAVCKYYNVSEEELCSNNRRAEIVGARRMFYYFCRKHFNLTYKSIADRFSQDHATVIFHEKKLEDFLTFDKDEMRKYIKVRDMVFDEVTFLDIKDEMDSLLRDKIIIDERLSQIKNELTAINNQNN